MTKTSKKTGKKAPKPLNPRFLITVPAEIRARWAVQAKKDALSQSLLVIAAVEHYMTLDEKGREKARELLGVYGL